jgi:hypothetical protein
MDWVKIKHQAWVERRGVALGQLNNFQQSALKDILGEKFASIMGLSENQLMQASRQLPPLSTIVNSSNVSAGRVLPPITKRKVPTPSHVIVIDDSD